VRCIKNVVAKEHLCEELLIRIVLVMNILPSRNVTNLILAITVYKSYLYKRSKKYKQLCTL
jgi:hypothetical protein